MQAANHLNPLRYLPASHWTPSAISRPLLAGLQAHASRTSHAQRHPALLPLHSALQDAKRNALRANGLCWLACGGMHLYNAGAGVQVRSAAFSNARLATNGLLPLVARHAGGSAGRAVPHSTSQQPARTETL